MEEIQLGAGIANSSSILQLPDVLLGIIFANLNRRAKFNFLHACKAFHESDACLQQVRSAQTWPYAKRCHLLSTCFYFARPCISSSM